MVTLEGSAAPDERTVTVVHAVVAGWTGRDAKAVQKHIEELEALGVQRPRSIPTFYRISATRITAAESIDVLGENSSGEVEFLLLQWAGELWLGVGSDHTDRTVETYDVAVSKQLCDKPIAPQFWRFADVANHWDSLILRSYIGKERGEYQAGSVATITAPQNLIAAYRGAAPLAEGTLMFCGTLPVVGAVRAASPFAFEIEDPVRKRRIQHQYRVDSLNCT
jgi:Protein of unknown function (DUF2848)